MTTVMKMSVSSKIDNDLIVTSTFEHIVSNEDDANEIGYQDAKLFMSYVKGYGKACEDETTS